MKAALKSYKTRRLPGTPVEGVVILDVILVHPQFEYVKTDKFPGRMKALGMWDMTFRKGVFKLPMSHLFYVLGEK